MLNSVIVEDETLSRDLTSYQTWSENNKYNATLGETADKLESAKAEVRDYIFYSLEIGEFDAVVPSEFINQIKGGSKLCPAIYQI